MKYRFMLLVTALVWGCAFVAQRMSTDTIGPFAFNGMRFAISAIVLIPISHMLSSRNGDAEKKEAAGRPPLWVASALIGFFLFAGSALQQLGLAYTTAGKAGFITSLYIVAVPLIGIALKKSLHLSHITGCLIAVMGLYLLAFHNDGSAINFGDLLELCGVLFWSLHILCVDRFVPYFDGVTLSCGQFITCAIYNFAAMLALGEALTLPIIMASIIPILYCGLFSNGVGYTFQIIAQKHVPPTETSLLCSLEMVFSALAGFIFLGEWMSSRELIGCLLMTIGIFSAQIPTRIILRGK